MKIYPIASSSSGNCVALEFGDDIILVDCGVPLKVIKKAIPELDRIKAVFITHEHGDHIGGVGPLSRKLQIPFYVNHASVEKKEKVFYDCVDLNDLVAGQLITIPGMATLMPFTTKHDSIYSVGFIITDLSNNKKLGYVTDTGFITPMMADMLKECDAIFIEADYDETSLEKYAEYPEDLKERISSNFGHLSNQQTLTFLSEVLDINKLQFIILGHMSRRTNSPELLRAQIKEYFPNENDQNKFVLAPTNTPISLT